MIVDVALADDEPDEIKASIKMAREAGDEGEWWISAELEPLEAETLGKELARHAIIANALNEIGVEGSFLWADDEDADNEATFLFRAEQIERVDKVPVFSVVARCKCGKTREGGPLTDYMGDDPPKPLHAFAEVLRDETWIVDDEGDGGFFIACRKRCDDRGDT